MKTTIDIKQRLDCLNILGVYYSAPLETKAYGLQWYKLAFDVAANISTKTGLGIETAISVISALSPNNKWGQNIDNADRLCAAYVNGANPMDVKVSTYNPNKEKAVKCLEESKSIELRRILNGQKVTAFYDCILFAGDKTHSFGREAVCVDGHAKSIYYGERYMLKDSKSNIGKKEYAAISAAYVTAAGIINDIEQPEEKITGCHVQAITWNHWRDIHGIK
tara:strand:+ start:498 stop:1160 length:663 start_codon:yes stop_codon:yes gene_type:complete